MSREREIPAGMEEQVVASEALHDEGAATWQDDLRPHVSVFCDCDMFCSNINLLVQSLVYYLRLFRCRAWTNICYICFMLVQSALFQDEFEKEKR